MISERSSDNDLVDGRYRLERRLGRGAQGTTHLAVDVSTGDQVALKELDFAGIGSWDAVAVFERESAVLGGLTHPNIPRIVESFRVEDDDQLRMFLTQEFVDGKDLRQRLDEGEDFDERRLRRLAGEVLDILAYLHGYTPPVLHRDIKPANLIERHNGSIALVDFGAAQGSSHGESVIGTTGYMPAEQLMGRAVPSSDLYALGATLIHLATSRHPAELGHGLGLRWRELAELSPEFGAWIEQLVAPVPEDRFPTALSAKRSLEQTKRRVNAELAAELERSMLDEVNAMLPKRSPHGRFQVLDTGSKVMIQSKREGHGSPGVVLIGILLVFVAAALGCGLSSPDLMMLAIVGVMPFIITAQLRQNRRGVSHIDVTPRGVVLVRRKDDVVGIVPLEEVAGPDIVMDTGGRALVLWKTDGQSVLLDYGTPDDLSFAHAAVQRGLARARRMSND